MGWVWKVFTITWVAWALGCSSKTPGNTMAMTTVDPVGGAGSGSAAGTGATTTPTGSAGTSAVAHAGAGGAAGRAGGAGAPGSAGAAAGTAGDAAGSAGAAGDSAGTPMPMFEDPGTAPWVVVPPGDLAAKCGMDSAMLSAADAKIGASYAVVRYGKLCHEAGADSAAEVYSATKTLGAVVTGIASYETRDFKDTGPMTGHLSDLDRADHWLASVTYNKDAKLAHVLSMIAQNPDLSYGNRPYSYDTVGSVEINGLSDMVNAAIKQDSARFGADIEAFTKKFLYEPLGMTDSTWSGGASTKTYAYTWSTTLHDMARVGVLVLHRGMWNGKRLLDESWTYKMTHPSFEDANTAYGYLTWLNAKVGATGPGGSFGGTAGDDCAPYALWPSYPHGTLSEAPDCLYGSGNTCKQDYDAGVWSAQGLGGQYIVGHPGLDLIIVAKNSNAGPAALWTAIRPALVALDPMFKGDEAAFCAAYNKGSYAPDLMTPPNVPTE
jgi:hypothetical protein